MAFNFQLSEEQENATSGKQGGFTFGISEPGESAGEPIQSERDPFWAGEGVEEGATPLNILKSILPTAEGIAKTGFQFVLATPYATARATYHSIYEREIDLFPDEFNRILNEVTTETEILGIKPFETQTAGGARFQHMFHEKIMAPIIGYFEKRADEVFEETNDPTLAAGIRTSGELVSLLVPILGIKGATRLSKAVVNKIPEKPVMGMPLGRGPYQDPSNLITFKEFNVEYSRSLPKGEKYTYQGARDAYRELNVATKEAKEGEVVREKNVEITKEDSPIEVSPAEQTMAPGIFMSSFEGLINPRTKKPYTDAAILRKYTKHVDDFYRPTEAEIGKFKVAPRRPFRGGTARTKQEMVEKDMAMRDMKFLIEKRKRSGKTLDPGITQEIAVKILENSKKAVFGVKSKRIYSGEDAQYNAGRKGEGSDIITGMSVRGVVSKGTKFFSDYEVLQLMEKAQTNKIVLESEFAKKLKLQDSIYKDAELRPESIKEMTSGRFDKRQTEQEAQKTIAKGPKEVKALSPKETEGTPGEQAVVALRERMWKKEGGWEGKVSSLGGKILPANRTELLKGISEDSAVASYAHAGKAMKYRGMRTKDQSMFSWMLGGTMYKSISLLNRWRNVSPTFAKVYDGMVAPDIHLALYDSKGAARRPRSADSFHTEKANIIGTFTTANMKNNGFKGLNEIFHDIKPGYFPGVQQIVRYGGKRMSAKNNLKVIRAVRGQEPIPKGKLGQVVRDLQELFRRSDKYIKEVFPDQETIVNYFPQSWNKTFVRKNQDQFITDLTNFLENPKLNKYFEDKYGKFNAAALAEEMSLNIIGEGRTVASNNVNAILADIKNMTGKENIKDIKAMAKRASGIDHSRILRDLPPETFEKYMKNDAYEGVQFYIEEMASRVEWARRFGENNELLYKGIIDGIKEANAKGVEIDSFVAQRALRLAEAMQGVYKMGGNKQWIRFQRGAQAILNAALLPLATVASFPEAMLPLYNGGVKAYARALPSALGTAALQVGKIIHKDFLNLDKTRAMIITEQIRKSGDIAVMERLNALWSGDTGGWSNAVFRLNMLHYWTKWMNHLSVGTYDAMVKDYFKSKVAGKKTGLLRGEEVRMERLMEYYGLDVAEGMAWSRAGSKLEGPFFEKLKRGAHMFAEDSVLTPNPAILPLWHSNPNLAWLRHLKTFPTLIGNKVIAKWGTETWKGIHDQGMQISGGRAGMYTIGTGMGLVGTAMLSNVIIDFIRYGEDGNPLYAKKYKNLSDIQKMVLRAVERAGIFGMGNYVFDSIFHSYTGAAGVFMGPSVAKADLLFKALADGLIKGDPRALARELVKLTPVLNVNKAVRDDRIKQLTDFFKENTFMDNVPGRRPL